MRASASLEELETGAHVWTASPDAIRDPAVLAHYRGWLSDDERRRVDRYVRPADGHLYLVAHALVRATLARYAPPGAPGADPADWAFRVEEHGRPEIAAPILAGPRSGEPLRFNLSHTRGLVACLVTTGLDCGVDVERPGRESDIHRLAQRVFSEREREDLRKQAPDRQRRRFFEYWTLKEAYIKARGLGLLLPLERFTFELGEGYETDPGRIGIAFEPPIDDRPADWQFTVGPAPGGERGSGGPGEVLVATALRLGEASDRAVVIRDTTPGEREP